MEIALYIVSAALILVGLAGTVLPVLPGVPLMYAGMFLAAWNDHYRHLGWGWLTVLGVLCALALVIDFVASLLGAKRVGASGWALVGASVGTIAGFFFGFVGVLVGPFAGAVAGELLAGSSTLRATQVGVGTWLGLLFGTLAKIALACAMLGMFGLAFLFG